MKPLALETSHSGYKLTQVHREGKLAIYAGQKINHSKPHHWEVIRIRSGKAFTSPDGVAYPDREVYPKSESWGTDGWTAMSLPDALKKLKEWALMPDSTPPLS